MGEVRTNIERNGHFIPNDGERWRDGEAITASSVESTVDQVISKRFCEKQPVQWSRAGAN